MNEGHNTMDIREPYTAKEGLHDGFPTAEANDDRDEHDLAVFGKRQYVIFSEATLPQPCCLMNFRHVPRVLCS